MACVVVVGALVNWRNFSNFARIYKQLWETLTKTTMARQ